MTFDTCTRIVVGSDPWCGKLAEARQTLGASSEEHLDAMHCVRAAFVVGYRSDRLGIHEPVERLARLVEDHPERRLGVAGIDPLADSVMDDLAQAIELGMVGVAMAPADQGWRPTHDRCMEVFRWCACRGLPVFIRNAGLKHSQSVLEYANPVLLDEAARAFPDLKLVLSGMGELFLDESLLLMQKHEHIFADTSGLIRSTTRLHRALLESYERHIIHKLLCASGFPNELPERAIARIYSVNTAGHRQEQTAIPREALRGVIERDVPRVLGIEMPLVSRRLPESERPRARKADLIHEIEP